MLYYVSYPVYIKKKNNSLKLLLSYSTEYLFTWNLTSYLFIITNKILIRQKINY